MKVATIVGARPQFVKAAAVSLALTHYPSVEEVLIHTGQHFDANMSEIFFDQLKIPMPKHSLNIHGGTHGVMTARMLEAVEAVLIQEKPDRVIVYGDTNSTLAGALAAVKLRIPVSHVEAGLRSFDRSMPEEVNRVVTDHVSDQLFCPTVLAVANLRAEGLDGAGPVDVSLVGDVMQDATMMFRDQARQPAGFALSGYALATIHRAENTSDPTRLTNIVTALNKIHSDLLPVVLPLHPRTREAVSALGLALDVHVLEPVGYLEMLWLLDHTTVVLTDSGGLQKEAFFFGVPCVTLRANTEWVELIDIGANSLAGTDVDAVFSATQGSLGKVITDSQELYGGGRAAARVAAGVVG